MKDTSKRTLALVLSIVGIILVIPMVLAVVMIIAPGIEIFGIKYVSARVGKFEQTINESYLYDNNIHLETNSVPVTITFGEGSGAYGVQFVQHYQGFTKGENTAGVEITNATGGTYGGTGDVYIKVKEYQKFIWANQAQDFYLKIKLPSSYITSGKIYVNSNTSDVTFSSTSATRTLNTIDVTTKGLLKFDSRFNITGTCSICSNGEIIVGDNLKVSGGIKIKTDNANVKINDSISGNIDFESNSGNLTFVSCANLIAKTHIGNITCSNAVNGNVNIETNYGNVNIPTISGSSNVIKSTYGNVDIATANAGNFTIEASRGNVNLGSVGNVTVTTGTGNITVGASNGSVTLSSNGGGNVLVTGQVYGNATVTTNGGSAIFAKAVGSKLKVTTNGGEVKFVTCQTLEANTGNGKISAFETSNTVNGNATITTSGGNISINTIAGSTNTISTSRGSVTVDSLSGTSTIETYENDINIGAASNLTIRSSYSRVTVGSVSSSISVTTNGNVAVGTTTKSVSNATIYAGSGEVTLVNTIGKVVACSNNKVTLNNTSSSDITINCEYNSNGVRTKTYTGGVEATGLKGKVNVYSNSAKNLNLTFSQITDNVNIEVGGACQTAVVLVNGSSYGDVRYAIKSRATSYVYNGNTKVSEGLNLASNAGTHKISMSSSAFVPLTLKFAG